MRRKKNDDQPSLFGAPKPEPKWKVRDDFPITSPQARKRAAERRDLGMERAETHANRVTPEWTERATEIFRTYCEHREEDFLTENFIVWAREKYNFVAPKDGRAWGSIVSRAARIGWITCIGSDPAVTSNLGLKKKWRSNLSSAPGSHFDTSGNEPSSD